MNNKVQLLDRKHYEKWLREMPSDYCPFCDWENNQILLYQTNNWLWIANRAPYWKYHTMLVTKNHYVEFDELEPGLLIELQIIYKKAIQKYRELYKDNVIDIHQRYLLFWRLRDNQLDLKSKIIKPNHFHLHLVPDKEHLFDKILDKDAEKTDISILRID